MNLANLIPEIVERHPNVTGVRLIGSRANGTAVPLSDWDFEVQTSDFDTLKADLNDLTASLAPLGQFWDPYSERANYILLLRGPVKVDLIFPDQPWPLSGPWEVNGETLPAIDKHFWDWTLWLGAKQQAGNEDLVASELAKMHENLLGPAGVKDQPGTLEQAIEVYLTRREDLESEFKTRLPRELGIQVVRKLRMEGVIA